MIDMNMIVSNNIKRAMSKQSKSTYDLLSVIGLSQTELREKLDGAKAFNAGELREVAGFLGTTTEELAKLPENYKKLDSIAQLHERCQSQNQHEAVDIADKLSDMILFHKKVRENGTQIKGICV